MTPLNKQVIQTLRKLGRERRSGILTSHGVRMTRYIVIREGEIVGARSSSKMERLGEVMVRRGHITEQHLKDATLFAQKGRRLGEVLAELCIIKQEDIEHYVRLQILEICSAIIIHKAERISFKNVKQPRADLENPIHVLDVVMESARRTPQIDDHIKLLMSDERHLSAGG